jgi:hypothetical protein
MSICLHNYLAMWYVLAQNLSLKTVVFCMTLVNFEEIENWVENSNQLEHYIL